MSSPLFCQKTYLLDGRCQKPTLGSGEFCRWHRIINEFRSDLSRKPRLFSQFLMVGAFFSLWQTIACASKFHDTSKIIWLPIAIVFLGAGIKFWADGIIARDYPLSQFAILAQLLAIGMILEPIGEISIGVCIGVAPKAAMPVIQALGNNPTWTKFGAPILAITAIVFAAVSVKMLLDRILFVRSPYLKGLLSVIAMGSATFAARGALSPAATKDILIPSIPSIDAQWAEKYWQPVLGDSIQLGLWSALIVSFILCEIINAGMRRKQCTLAVFKATVWPSFPICFGSPFIGILVSRYLMTWLGLHDAILFMLISVVAAGAICKVFTKWIITAYSNRTLPHEAKVVPDGLSPTGPRQEVYLFLNLSDELMFAEYVQQLTGISDGQVASGGFRNGYYIVAMNGPNARKLLGAAMQALEHYAIGLGSFAVIRYGGAGAPEERISLC